MTEDQANTVADIVGGDVWQSGGGIWLVVIHRRDGAIVTISDEVMCEFPNKQAFDDGAVGASITLV